MKFKIQNLTQKISKIKDIIKKEKVLTLKKYKVNSLIKFLIRWNK